MFVLYLFESDNLRRVVRALMVRLRGDNTFYRQQENAATTVDADVAAERQRITSTSIEQLRTTDIVILRQLTKIYDSGLRYLIKSKIRFPFLTVLNIFLKTNLFSLYNCHHPIRGYFANFSYLGLFVPSMNYSYLGLFVPWTVRTILDCSYH